MGRLDVMEKLAGTLMLVMLVGCGESTARSGTEGAGATAGAGAAGGSGTASGSGGRAGGSGGVSASAGENGRAGTSGGGPAGGVGGASGGGGANGGSSEYFVSALVDGTPVRAEMNVRTYWFQGLSEAQLALEGSTADRRFDFVFGNYVAENPCNYVVLNSVPVVGGQAEASFVEGGRCDMTLTALAPNVGDIIEGTFSAVVGPLGSGPLVTLTEGRFRAPRVPDGSPP
jgi:hypothetical protein